MLDLLVSDTPNSIFYRDIDLSKCSEALLSNDKVGRYLYAGDYKIYGIAGKLLFYENINDCYVKQNEILNELSTLLKDTDKVSETLTHSVDSTGRSKIKSITWWLKSEDLISLDCYDWHEDMPYIDNLKVAADTKEFNDWLVEWQ